jgi:hypothetical protein
MPAAHNRVEMTGLRFGKLLVLGYSHTNEHRKPVWKCLCDCGNVAFIRGFVMRSGHTVSCGCYGLVAGREHLIKRQQENFIHGAVGTPTYKSWDSAKQRCFNPNDDHFEGYAARGITMCIQWRESFPVFLTDMGERPKGRTLHRIDNDGNYEPGNCKWATAKEQCENRRPRKRRIK